MQFERPITKKMKAAAEAERLARLEAEYKASLAKQQAELAARLEQAKSDWEVLIKALPKELDKLEQLTLELISEWEHKASAPIDWEELQEPICSTAWELRFNQYERFDNYISHYYESSDGMRSGVDTEKVVREKMPGSYWINPKDPSGKEWFISRASSPDDPAPPVQYPYCTISGGEINLWDRFSYSNDKERIEAIIQKHEENRKYYRTCIQEAEAALKGTAHERVKYLLSRQEADRVRNELKQVWRILNPDKSESLFWDDILKSIC